MATRSRKRVGRDRSGFGTLLRRQLDAQDVSTRELARRLTASEPERIENTRRSLIRYIQGEVAPGPEMRDAIAAALSVDSSVFAEDLIRSVRRERVLDALQPLADVLLDLAVEVGNETKDSR